LEEKNEIEMLSNLVEKLLGDDLTSKRVIFIEGDPGIGKSRLLQEIHKEFYDNKKLKVYNGKGNSIEEMTPYFPYSEILSNIFELQRFVSHYSNKKIREIICVWLKENLKDYEDLAPLLNDVLPLDWEDNLITENFRGRKKADKLRELLLKIIMADGDKCKLFILDNTQWFDYQSWQLTFKIAKNIKNSIILIALRQLDNDENIFYQRLKKQSFTEEMQLKGLDDESIIELLKRKLKNDDIPQIVLEESVSIIQSSPLIALEIAEQIRSGTIDINNLPKTKSFS